MTMITPSTELEAVNTMLRAIGESPVSSLYGDVGVDVVTAKHTLMEIMKAVQTEGWIFNTEYDYPLNRNVSGQIVVPANALLVDIARSRFGDIDPVMRGSRVYDRKNHTFIFTVDLKAKIIFGLPFTDMPESARHYVTYRAVRKFQDNSLGSSDLHRYNERDELMARVRFMDEQAEDEDLNFLKDTPGFNQLWSN
jgi:hypothetical protein